MIDHPDNRGGKFNISLFNELKLNEQWEVGLHEMFYHDSDWPHLEKSECRIIVKGMYDTRNPEITNTLANEDVFVTPGERIYFTYTEIYKDGKNEKEPLLRYLILHLVHMITKLNL